jgi:hypothetical protein
MSSQKKLKIDAKKFLSLKDLFPKKPPDFRKKLTPYQAKKIRAAIKAVKDFGGEYSEQIVPMGRGRKKYLDQAGLPPYMRGIFLSGGEKINKKLEFVGGAIKYERGGSPRERYELFTEGGADELIDSAKEILIHRKNRKAAITANGRVIGAAYPLRKNDLIIREAVYIFNKYATMYDNEEYRDRFNKGQVLAAHPSTWGMGILFETGSGKNGTKKKASARRSGK